MSPLISVLFAMSILCAPARSAPLQTQLSTARFLAIASPGNLKIQGETPADQLQSATLVFDDSRKELRGTIKVKLDQIDTGIELRNNHLRNKCLHVGQFPEAVFSFVPTPLPTGGGPFFLAGSLSLHGKTVPIRAEARVQEDGAAVAMQLAAKLRLADFAIEAPQFLGVKVRDEVEISFEYRGTK